MLTGALAPGTTLYTIDETPEEQQAKPTTATAQDTEMSFEDETHAYRLETQQQLDAGKGTAAAYDRHLKRYISFWAEYAVATKTNPVSPFPIIATKVAKFMEQETTRKKVCGC